MPCMNKTTGIAGIVALHGRLLICNFYFEVSLFIYWVVTKPMLTDYPVVFQIDFESRTYYPSANVMINITQ